MNIIWIRAQSKGINSTNINELQLLFTILRLVLSSFWNVSPACGGTQGVPTPEIAIQIGKMMRKHGMLVYPYNSFKQSLPPMIMMGGKNLPLADILHARIAFLFAQDGHGGCVIFGPGDQFPLFSLEQNGRLPKVLSSQNLHGIRVGVTGRWIPWQEKGFVYPIGKPYFDKDFGALPCFASVR